MTKQKELVNSYILKRWSIAFWNDNGKIGELKFTDEGLKFTGNADECARNFFTIYVKKIVDKYIEQKLKNKKKTKTIICRDDEGLHPIVYENGN